MAGPPPKRTEQRRNRVTPDAEKAQTPGTVKVPAASKDWHPIARDWFRSLAKSGQSQYYTASDWQAARYLAEMMSRSLQSEKVNAQLISTIMSGMTDLLATEGARRRARLELERPQEGDTEEANDVSWIDDARARLRSAN